MKTLLTRAIAYSVVVALGYLALRVNPPITAAPRPVAALVAVDTAPRVPRLRQHFDTVGRGQTLGVMLERWGAGRQALEALRTAKLLDPRRIPAGMPVTVSSVAPDSVPEAITLQLAVDHLVHLRRTATGWVGSEERLPWVKDTIAIAGEITSTLYEALDSSAATALTKGARAELAWTLADIYEYRIDMSRDLRTGDKFRALFERQRGPNGIMRVGKVLAASFENGGTKLEAIRFQSASARGEYFDRDGKSLRAPFLRAPLAFRRISSVFGMRRHPILRTWRAHKGTDYAAASGTPVRAVGDGVVSFAGWRGGYGKVVEVRHRNGYVTRHAHLRGFAKGMRPGARVSIGQTIAYVGSTGLSTAPHLHFEVLVKGVHRDPRVALRVKGGDPIPAKERQAFAMARETLLAALEARAGDMQLAQR